MAEGILKSMLKQMNIGDINVSSAGITALEGEAANEKAIATLNKKGINIKNNRARQLTKEFINKSELILTMTRSHKKMILDFFPGYSHRIYTLKEYACVLSGEETVGKDMDISDPFGFGYDVYEKTAEEIEEQLKKIITHGGIK